MLLIHSIWEKIFRFCRGIAVNSLGHCHPKLVNTLNKQSKLLWHTSNLYKNRIKNYLQKNCVIKHCRQSFFTNSGAEAIECGLKVIKVIGI